jgi:hypothetical protein
VITAISGLQDLTIVKEALVVHMIQVNGSCKVIVLQILILKFQNSGTHIKMERLHLMMFLEQLQKYIGGIVKKDMNGPQVFLTVLEEMIAVLIAAVKLLLPKPVYKQDILHLH